MDEIFIFLGKSTACIFGVLVICWVAIFIWDSTQDLYWRYKYKHRFDKKPTAKCYCNDCKYHGKNNDNTLCQLHDRHFPSDWFCKDAKPKSAK